MKKKAIQLLRWLLLLLGCICLITAGVRAVQQWQLHSVIQKQLGEEFVPAASSYNADGAYAGLPLEATNFAGFAPLFPSAQTLMFQEGIVREYTLPCDVIYYSWDGSDRIPALVLDAGTEILFFPTETEGAPSIPAGYGIRSFPGLETGWRYAVPFLTAQQPLMEDQAVLSQQDWDYYHVRLSDLEAVCSGYWNELEWDYSLQSRRRMGISVRELCSLQLLSTDTILYQSGIYQSPDLSVPLWDNTDTLLVSAGVAMIVLFAVHPKRTSSNRKVY